MAVAKKSFRHRMGKFLQWLNPLKAGVAQRLHGRFPPSGFLPLCERQTTPIVAQLVGLFRSLFGAANSRRLGVASGASRCCALRIEALEPRRLLSATYWVNDNWVVTAPQSDIGNAPVAGDTVANTGAGGDGSVTGETFGVNAFATVQDAGWTRPSPAIRSKSLPARTTFPPVCPRRERHDRGPELRQRRNP